MLLYNQFRHQQLQQRPMLLLFLHLNYYFALPKRQFGHDFLLIPNQVENLNLWGFLQYQYQYK